MKYQGIKTDNYNLVIVERNLLDEYLPKLAPMLRESKTRARNGKSLEQMIDDLNREKKGVQLWMCFDADHIYGCFVTTAMRSDRGVIFTIEILSSDFGLDWIHETIGPFEQAIHDNYRACELRIIGPRAWYKILQQHGYDEPMFITAKQLGDHDMTMMREIVNG